MWILDNLGDLAVGELRQAACDGPATISGWTRLNGGNGVTLHPLSMTASSAHRQQQSCWRVSPVKFV